MRADWREHDRVESWINDRTSGGERVCGRAGWRRDDQAVGAIRAEGRMVGYHVELEHPAERTFADYHVVERLKRLWDLFGCAIDDRFEHDAPIDFVIAREHASQGGLRFRHRHLGQKAEAAKVHA